jgi:hypothetical protein
MQDAPILDALGTDVVENLVSRRDAIAKSGKVGGLLAAGMAIGSMPVALAALSREAYGQAPTSTIIDTLQFALFLEIIEAEFYRAVTGTSQYEPFNIAFGRVRGQLTPAERATLNLIRDHEVAHVQYLVTAIVTAGGAPMLFNPATTFDFTGGRGSGTGPFLSATTDKSMLLLAAQLFEDTGVRAYKGQAGNLLRSGDVLQAALQIHSVEARHAAKIRRMRRAAGVRDGVRFSGTVYGEGTFAAGVTNATSLPFAEQLAIFGPYAGEGNHNHVVNNGTADVTINADTLTNLFNGPDVSTAFDEPLTRGQVLQIVRPFVIPDLPLLP